MVPQKSPGQPERVIARLVSVSDLSGVRCRLRDRSDGTPGVADRIESIALRCRLNRIRCIKAAELIQFAGCGSPSCLKAHEWTLRLGNP